jgi:hypothetical protein
VLTTATKKLYANISQRLIQISGTNYIQNAFSYPSELNKSILVSYVEDIRELNTYTLRDRLKLEDERRERLAPRLPSGIFELYSQLIVMHCKMIN